MTTAAPALDAIVEAALLASEAPLDLEALQQLFEGRQVPSRGELRAALTTLEHRLEGTAMTLHSSVSGFRLAINKTFAPWLSRLWEERPQRYSRALMETLALIAYRQPVTRGDIEEVRGVAVSASIMRTLLDRGWIRVIGQRDVPGRPSVYATTRRFLDDFNLQTLDELPPLHEVEERFGISTQMVLDDQDSDAAAQHNDAVLNGMLPQDSEDAAVEGDDDASASEPDDNDIDALVPPPLAGETLDFSTLQARLDARVEAAAAARRAATDEGSEHLNEALDDEWPETPEAAESDSSVALIHQHDERSLNDE
ncbi:SMC-Scp complex subunit ScpB [Zymobacter sp. IVIA_12111.31 C1]|uniref:SMC-Scp complex subunit ScpB n=1 Tax=Zymobacter sp. IVIA_12111.31 C1 TaxID=3394854 RepID=UPI0039C183DF